MVVAWLSGNLPSKERIISHAGEVASWRAWMASAIKGMEAMKATKAMKGMKKAYHTMWSAMKEAYDGEPVSYRCDGIKGRNMLKEMSGY